MTLFVACFFLVLKLELEKLARTDTRSRARRIWSYPSIFHHLDRGLQQHRKHSSRRLRNRISAASPTHSPSAPAFASRFSGVLTMSYTNVDRNARQPALRDRDHTQNRSFLLICRLFQQLVLFISSRATAVGSSSGNAMSEAGSSGGGMFGGLLSRIPTTSSALTSSSAAPRVR